MSSGYVVNASAFAYSGAVAKTIVNVINSTNGVMRATEIGVSFDGTSASATPALVELCKSTQAGAGTAGSSPTPTQIRGTARASLCTAGIKYSAEPTTLTVLKSWYVPQFMGVFVKQMPLGREEEQGTSVNALCLRVTSTATVNVSGYIEFEEG